MFTGKDSKIHVAEIRTQNGVIVRPLALYPSQLLVLRPLLTFNIILLLAILLACPSAAYAKKGIL